MNTDFVIQPITYSSIQHLFELDTTTLSQQGIIKMTVNQFPGFPCRVSLEDAQIGEEVLLFPYTHHSVESPYQATGPIFVRKNAKTVTLKVNEIPIMLNHRLLSLRIYDNKAMMIDAKTMEGKNLKRTIQKILQNKAVEYIQIHNAGPGCYNCQVNRVLDTLN